MGFRISYDNPHLPVPEPVVYDEYDVVSAIYDYMPAGARASIVIDGYTLELTDLMFINWVRESLPLAEQLSTLPADQSYYLRKFLPDLPLGSKAYFWIVADVMIRAPILIFVVDGETVRIYTRTDADLSGPELVLSERDRTDPVVVLRGAVIEELRSFLTRYLDDLSATFPFIRADPVYQDYRQRIAAVDAR